MTAIKMGDSYSEEGEETPEAGEEQEEAKQTPEKGEEKETPSESSAEEKPDAEEPEPVSDTTESTNEGEGEGVEEKEIQGLAAQKERLSQEIAALRAERREIRSKPEEPLLVEEKIDLSDVAESDVKTIEKVLKAKGYVRQSEIQGMTYKQQVDSYKDQWLEAHPEYLPANDPEDKKWQALNYELSNFYKAPQNPKDIAKILDRVHSAISKGSLPVKSSAQVKSSQEKVKVSSRSSVPSGSKTIQQKKSINRNAFIGFSDDELEELET